MNSLTPFFFANRPYDQVIPWLKRQLGRAGLRVMQTFDLSATRLGPKECTCPHHGTDKCDCQMVVLLVYGSAAKPAALILHGNDGQSWLTLVDQPGQQANPQIVRAIRGALEIQSPIGI